MLAKLVITAKPAAEPELEDVYFSALGEAAQAVAA